MDDALTIVTVVIEKHHGYIPEQLRIIDALNPGADFRLLVVDNAAMAASTLKVPDSRCEVITGVAPAAGIPEEMRGSYHHAAALNSALPRVRTRYLAVIDPDLFLVYRHWIAEVTDHMRRSGLAVFGVPWHPRWYRKQRNLPCVHFLVLDLSLVDRAAIDFTPALIEDHVREGGPGHRWLQRHALPVYQRLLLGSRRDTGWRINHDLPAAGRDLALPILDLERDLTRPPHLLTLAGRRRERLAPRRWSYLPPPGSIVTPEQAPVFDHPSFRRIGAEKFVWRGAPFAFHLRRNVRDFIQGGAGREDEPAALARLLADVAAAPSWRHWSSAA